MRPTVLALALVAPSAAAWDALTPRPTRLTEPELLAVHDRLPTPGAHVDIGLGHGTETLDPGRFDRAQVALPSMRIGGPDAGFFVVDVPQGELDEEGHAGAVQAAEEKYRGSTRMLRAYPDRIALAATVGEVESLVADGMLVARIENGYPLGTTPGKVAERAAMWAERGALRLDHAFRAQPVRPLLRPLGRSRRRRGSGLDDCGIMVDVSHVGPRTAADAMAASRAPVIASHFGAAGVTRTPRNLADDQPRAIAEGDAVAQSVATRSHVADEDPATREAVGTPRDRPGSTPGAASAEATPAVPGECAEERRRIHSENVEATPARFVDQAVEVADIDHVGLSDDFGGGGDTDPMAHPEGARPFGRRRDRRAAVNRRTGRDRATRTRASPVAAVGAPLGYGPRPGAARPATGSASRSRAGWADVEYEPRWIDPAIARFGRWIRPGRARASARRRRRFGPQARATQVMRAGADASAARGPDPAGPRRPPERPLRRIGASPGSSPRHGALDRGPGVPRSRPAGLRRTIRPVQRPTWASRPAARAGAPGSVQSPPSGRPAEPSARQPAGHQPSRLVGSA